MLATFIVSGAWIAWWILPERPLRAVTVNANVTSARVSPDGKYAWLGIGRDEEQYAIIRLSDGVEVVPRDWVGEDAEFLEGDRAILHDKIKNEHDSARLVDLNAQKVIGEVKDAWVWCWSKDGSVIACERRPDEDHSTPMLVVTAANGDQQVIVVPDAAWSYFSNPTSERIVTQVKSDSEAFAVWDARTGREVKRIRLPGCEVDWVQMSHDARRACATFTWEDCRGNFHKGAYVWDITSENPCEPVSIPRADGVSDQGFDPTDRYVSGSDGSGMMFDRGLWDLTTTPPTYVKLNGIPFFDPAGRHYTIGNGWGPPFTWISEWAVYDAKTHRHVVTLNTRPTMNPHFPKSADGSWMAYEAHPPASVLRDWCSKWLGWSYVSNDCVEVVNLDTGRIMNRITQDWEIAGFTNEGHIWTYHPIWVGEENDPQILILREWQVGRAAPWYLYFFTAAGLFVILADLRRQRTRQSQIAAA